MTTIRFNNMGLKQRLDLFCGSIRALFTGKISIVYGDKSIDTGQKTRHRKETNEPVKHQNLKT